jgi:hypothetical protein
MKTSKKLIKKLYQTGGVVTDPPVKTKSKTTQGLDLVAINPNTTPEQQKLQEAHNLYQSLKLQNALINGKYINTSEHIPFYAVGTQKTGLKEYAPTTQNIQEVDPMALHQMDSVLARPRPKFDTGGPKKKTATYGMPVGEQVAGTILQNNPSTVTDPAASKPKFDLSGALGSAAPYMDNLANLITASKTPQIPDPITTAAPRLNTKVNVNPQLKRINDSTAAASRGIDMTTASAGVAAANKGKLLADKFRAIGDVEANKQNVEAGLQNQAAMADYQNTVQNNALKNQRNFNQMQRQDDINQRYGSVLSDFGNDIANVTREKNLMAKDKDALKILMKVNPDSAYQFADSEMFSNLFKDDEAGLRKLISGQKGSEQKAKLAALYKKLYNKEFKD